MHTICLARYMERIRAGDWEAVSELMLISARKLAGCGVELLLCPDNTIHQAMPDVRRRSPVPFLHIAEEVGRQARGSSYRRLGITGTKYLMTGPVYPDALAPLEIDCRIPDAPQRERIDEIIFNELVYGRTTEASLRFFQEVIEGFRADGCDAVVLGCTEIPLLVKPENSPLPVLDSTRLLARAALARSSL